MRTGAGPLNAATITMSAMKVAAMHSEVPFDLFNLQIDDFLKPPRETASISQVSVLPYDSHRFKVDPCVCRPILAHFRWDILRSNEEDVPCSIKRDRVSLIVQTKPLAMLNIEFQFLTHFDNVRYWIIECSILC